MHITIGRIIKERIRGNEENPDHIFGDIYDLSERKDFNDVGEFATILNAMGKNMKAWVGIELCLKRPGIHETVNKIYAKYRRDIGRSLSWFEENRYVLKERGNGYFILAGTHIPEHIISNVVSILANSEFSEKPIFAFVDTEEGNVKISGRASDELVDKGTNMMEMMKEAATAVGGEGGGHIGAAGATIPKGTEERFISIVEEILGKGTSGFLKEKTKLEQSKLLKEVDNGNKTDTKTDGKKAGSERGSKKREIKRKEGASEGEGIKKMEGKGLVRYFNP